MTVFFNWYSVQQQEKNQMVSTSSAVIVDILYLKVKRERSREDTATRVGVCPQQQQQQQKLTCWTVLVVFLKWFTESLQRDRKWINFRLCSSGGLLHVILIAIRLNEWANKWMKWFNRNNAELWVVHRVSSLGASGGGWGVPVDMRTNCRRVECGVVWCGEGTGRGAGYKYNAYKNDELC